MERVGAGMCLEVKYRGEKKRKVLAGLPECGYYWKVVNESRLGRYYKAPIFGYIYAPGENRFPKPGAYFFRKERDARRWFLVKTIKKHGEARRWGKNQWYRAVLVRVRVRREDIVGVGEQAEGLCIIARRAEFPKDIPNGS